jgi:hypothetical protein
MSPCFVQVKANDADSGVNGEIFYSLADDDPSILPLIDIDERTGAVRLKTPIDYETHRRLEFTVRARDGGTKQLWDSTQVSVGVWNSFFITLVSFVSYVELADV